MNPRHRNIVLVLSSLVSLSLIWAGCAGVAEAPSLAVAPGNLTVSAKVGSASSLPVTLTNTGQTSVSVMKTVLAGTGFSMTGLATPLSLTAGQSATFSVKFLASQVGVVNGSVEFVTDPQHHPAMLPLHGTGSTVTPQVASIVVSPAVAAPAPKATVQFTAAIQGATTNNAVTWTASIGTISSAGVFTAPSAGGVGQVIATSVADPTKSASATVRVGGTSNQAPSSGVTSVTVTPATASSITGGTLTFTAAIQGTTSNKAVTWKALLGTINSTGLYTAPAKAGTDTVTATSVADGTKSASATIKVTTAAASPVVNSVTVSPGSTSVAVSGSYQFKATVQGTATDTSVTWTAALGTMNSSGLYKAPAKATTDTVMATSNADSSKSASATVTVSTAATPNPPAPSASVSCSGSHCAAFPGAEGGGAASAGGRGGVVMEVTNLNDSGNGSLRACVEASGPRTCVFRVGGNIVNQSRLQVSNPYLTIAGQTAPGGGITIGGTNMKGEALFVDTHDVIVRYITCNGNNPNTPTGPDTGTVCFEATSGTHDVIWDHISVRWWGNKGFITYSNDTSNINNVIKNITLQNALVYEPNMTHPVGPGADAAAWPNEAINQDFHHILFANIGHRIPMVATSGVRVVSTITYNWNYFAVGLGGSSIDLIDNKWVPGNMNAGNSNPHPVNVWSGQGGNCTSGPACDLPGTASVHMSGNVGPQGTDFELTAEEAGTDAEGTAEIATPIPTSWQRSTPLPTEPFPITADSPASLDAMAPSWGNSLGLDCDGNWISHQDSQDARIIAQYQARGSGNLFTGQFSQPAIAAGTACTESMHDGIPDQWKVSKGLSTSDATLFKATAPNGYTWLENYLNGQ
jgi:hypothetical protein